MLERELKVGSLYRHFKGGLYRVVCVARDSESLEYMVVYKNEETGDTWVRSVYMFMGSVDREKYPDVKQEYRFELVEEQLLILQYLIKYRKYVIISM